MKPSYKVLCVQCSPCAHHTGIGQQEEQLQFESLTNSRTLQHWKHTLSNLDRVPKIAQVISVCLMPIKQNDKPMMLFNIQCFEIASVQHIRVNYSHHIYHRNEGSLPETTHFSTQPHWKPSCISQGHPKAWNEFQECCEG